MGHTKQDKILVVGNYSHDRIIDHTGQIHETPGGAAAYISAILNPLDIDYSVVAKVGQEFRFLHKVCRTPIVVPNDPTTSFLNDYSGGKRRQILEAVCEPIFHEDIRSGADIGLVCGIFHEVPPKTILRMREVCDVLVADVQGLLRYRDEDNRVGQKKLQETIYWDLLECFDYLQVSSEEVRFIELETLRRRTSVIVTEGPSGCKAYHREESFSAPGYKVSVKDATGAGDCFLAGFACGLAQHLPLQRTLEFANYCGALAVQQVGLPKLKEEDFQSFHFPL